MVFCDMGVHPTSWGYSAYDDITTKLVARGVPRCEIAMIGEAESDAKKQSLFERVRAGHVRVLLGTGNGAFNNALIYASGGSSPIALALSA